MRFFSKTPPDNIYLEFYSLYKQATAGDCNIEKPSTDADAQNKWEAWNSRKGMSKDAAKAAYIEAYNKYAADYA